MKPKGLFLLAVCTWWFGAGLVAAQTVTTGDLTGVVQDATGAVVPGATVTLKSAETGALRTATTNAEGTYRFAVLSPGAYELTAGAASLKSDRERVTVSVGQVVTVNIPVKVQSTETIVEVSGLTGIVDTQSANITTSISAEQLADLPLAGGDLTAATFTVPGVVMSTGSGYGNMEVHGLPSTSTLFTVNGNDYNDAYLNVNNSGASNLLLGANEISEVAVVMNPYSVQYGRQAGAQVDYTTKSGTNAFHGNLLWNWNGDRLNANTFFNNANGVAVPRSVSNQYAASIGGPIKKNKLFFFADTEGIRYALPAASVVTIPSVPLENYILTNLNSTQQALYTKAFNLWNNAPGASTAATVTNGDGTLQDSNGNLGCGDLAGTAAPGGGVFGTNVSCARAWAANGSNLNTEWLLTTRVDYNIKDKHRIYFRYKADHGRQPTATSLISPVLDIQSLQPQYEGQVAYTWIISPTMVNNIIGSGSWYSAFFGPADLSAAVAALPANFFISDGGSNGSAGFTQAGVGSKGEGFNYFPQGRNVGQGQITDDFSMTKGKHTIKIGVNFRKDRITDQSLETNVNGYYNFASLTDFATGSLVSGNSNYIQSFPEIFAAHIRYYSLGLYLQDEWNIKPNLKITAGIRLDRNSIPTCVDKCFSRMDEQFSSPAFAKGVDIPYNQSITTGLTDAFANQQPAVAEPRIGIVWSPHTGIGTVVRAGFGLFSDLAPGQLAQNVFLNSPVQFVAPIFSGLVDTTNDPAAASTILLNAANAFRSGFAQGYTYTQLNNALSSIGGFSPPSYFSAANNVLYPKYLEWSFEIQQPVGSHNVVDVVYTGNHGRDEFTINPAVNGFGFAGLPAAAPDPRFAYINELTNGGISNYQGVTVAFKRSFAKGVQGEIGYTWSHSLDDVSNGGAVIEPFNYTASNISQPYLTTPFGPKFNYSNSDYDVRHNLTADAIWQLPIKAQRKVLNALIGGWTLSGKLYARTGLPFSVYDLDQTAALIGQNVNTFAYNSFMATPAGTVSLSCGRSGVNTPCFTPSQFVASGSETGWGLPRNSFRGPGYFDLDGTVYKKFAIGERTGLTIGATAYNLTNHSNFDTPNANIAGSGFGLITNTVTQPTSAYGAFVGAATSARLLVLNTKFDF